MKILFIDNNERSLFPFRKEFLDRLILDENEILLAGNFAEKTINEYANKVRVVTLGVSLKSIDPFKNLGYIFKVKKLIKEFKPDLMLTYTVKPNIFPNLFKHDCVSIANITGLGRVFNKKGILNILATFLYRYSFRNVSHVMFQNEHDKEVFLSKKIPVRSFSVIPGSGVNLETFSYNELTKHEETRFLFPSRAIKTKGMKYMLKAIPLVLANHPEATFSFLQEGEKGFERKMKKLQKEYPNNIFISSFTFGIVSKYQECDFVVSPSFHNEGVSNVLIESLAVGRPIITTNDNYGCKITLKEGLNGFGVKSKDVSSLVSVLNKACDSSLEERIKMGQFGRKLVEKEFSREFVISEYLRVIDFLVNKRKK